MPASVFPTGRQRLICPSVPFTRALHMPKVPRELREQTQWAFGCVPPGRFTFKQSGKHTIPPMLSASQPELSKHLLLLPAQPRPRFLFILPSQLGTEMNMRTSLSEIRGKSPELLTARHGSMRKKGWMATYHQGPCSWGPSLPWGPAAHSRSTPRGRSLDLLSPAGSRRSSWPEPHHQTHGAGHGGTPWRGALPPAGCPEAPALGSADG